MLHDPSEDPLIRLARDQEGSLPGLLSIRWTHVGRGEISASLDVQKHHMAPTGFLHAATVMALADTACGYGCLHSLPERATGFTTAELKANFIGTARQGRITCSARLVHGGRTTQVWDAEIKQEHLDKTIALFRCTQILLCPERAKSG